MSWRPLTLPASAAVDLPPILISTTFRKDAYTIHLTDLSHIWSEALDRKAIIRRSRDEDTSIDPSSSPDQFAILLDKIRQGLAGEKGTACSLTIGHGEGRPALEFGVTVDLPGGLAPLEWTFKLASSGDGAVKDNLITPLLRLQHIQHKEIDGLREVIKDKDHVIQKLLDKLESMGTDLGQVFAQAAGRPGRKGDWHKDRVKGLAAFNYAPWRRDVSQDQPEDLLELLMETFGGTEDETKIVKAVDTAPRDEQDSWWQSIGGLTINLGSGKVSTMKGNNKGRPTNNQSTEEDDISATPHQKVSSPQKEAIAGEEEAFEPLPNSQKADEETEDDDDLDAPSQAQLPQKAQSPLLVSKPKKTLGKIGGKKKTPSPSPVKSPDHKSRSSGTPDHGEPVSSADTAKEDAAPSDRADEALPKPKKKLGQIGGKKKREATPPPEPADDEETASSVGQQTPKKKLGVIGHRKETPKKEEEEPARGRQAVKAERSVTPPPRETSDERADRKREQLKKELEQRAKAPAKKKRKL